MMEDKLAIPVEMPSFLPIVAFLGLEWDGCSIILWKPAPTNQVQIEDVELPSHRQHALSPPTHHNRVQSSTHTTTPHQLLMLKEA